jgi:phosphonate transport system substrate-binding protein
MSCYVGVILLVFSSAVQAADTNGIAPESPAKFRLAFSIGIIGEINRNDAKASTLAWGKMILSQRNIVAETVPTVFDRPDDLFRTLHNEEIDAAAVLANEFLAHPAAVPPDGVFLSVRNGKTTEQYVLLVRQDSGIQDAAGLKGRSLELQESARTSLAPAWLDTVLAEHKLGLTEDVFSKITRNEKVSRVIQRLFFRQTDACIATREAFATAGELNPQVQKELRVLATSQEVVPSCFFFRPGFSSNLRQRIEESVLLLNETAAGKQVLTVFQGERLEKHPLSCLDSARALVAEQARLRGAAPEKGAVAAWPGVANP